MNLSFSRPLVFLIVAFSSALFAGTLLTWFDYQSLQAPTAPIEYSSERGNGECHFNKATQGCWDPDDECDGNCQMFVVETMFGMEYACICECFSATADRTLPLEHAYIVPNNGSKPFFRCAPFCPKAQL